MRFAAEECAGGEVEDYSRVFVEEERTLMIIWAICSIFGKKRGDYMICILDREEKSTCMTYICRGQFGSLSVQITSGLVTTSSL